MLFKKIVFSKNSFWVKLQDKEFDFIANNKKSAVFTIFIGKNGSGKSTLIDFIFQIIKNMYLFRYPNLYISNVNDSNTNNSDYFEFVYDDKIHKIKLSEDKKNGKIHMKLRHDTEYSDFFNFLCIHNDLSYVINEYSFYSSSGARGIDFMSDCFNDFGEYTITKQFYGSQPIVFGISNDNTKNTIWQFWRNSKITQDSLIGAADMSEHETKNVLELFKKKNIFHKLNEQNNEYKFNVTNDGRNIFIMEKNGKCYLYDCLSSGFKKRNSILVLLHKLKNDISKKSSRKSSQVNINLFFDEIENSFCPIEQEQIIKKIIDDIDEMNKKDRICQLFIATHSPYILKNFLNRDDTVIINVENGKKLNRDKKLIFNNIVSNNITSYDEISYLYYDIISSSYYVSLYETMRQKFDDLCEQIKSFITPLIENLNNTNEYKNKSITSNLFQLWDESCIDWNSFVAKFDDEEWKDSKKNKPIIDNLVSLLGCSSNEINRDRINGLDSKMKNIIDEFIIIFINLKSNGFENLLDSLFNDVIHYSLKWKYNIDEFLLEKKLSTSLKGKIWIVASTTNWRKMKRENRTIMNNNEELKSSTNLTRLRNILVHNGENYEWNYQIYNDENNIQKFKKFSETCGIEGENDKTKYFYEQYKKQPEDLLKQQIEIIREILINWGEITNIFSEDNNLFTK